MGIIKWGLQAAGSAYADQPKESFRASNLSNDVLAAPAERVSRGSNKGTVDVITDGSVFNVGINQAALLIENGKVHDFVIADSEEGTGQYIYDSSTEPSLLTGGVKEWGNVWKMVKERFTFGGQSPNTMNLVYVNLKEITENPVGVGKIPFIDKYLGTRLMLGAHGYYTFRISNPAAFYENLLMDPTKKYRKDEITGQLKAEMMPKIASAIAKVAPLCVNGYQDIYLHDTDIANALNQELGEDWLNSRGIELVKVSLTPELSPADAERVMELENAKTLSNADMALGSMINAQNQAMQSAGKNAAGAVNGFMGVNMAGGGGFNAGDLLAQKMASQQTAPAQQAAPAADGSWTCTSCGATNTGKFCTNCGSPKPAAPAGKFCSNCGTKLDASAKFCPNCGAKQ
ncbi:MAG: SPFH domain-containing protein [Erysipelotrichaceae bacterium]|nr:SPFH domain-containing protein [Erysipelotrichaceae bacterium]